MKLLHIDIETAPHKVYCFGLWQQDIHPDNIAEPGYTLCWSAKWHGSREIMFDSIHKSKFKDMIKSIHSLMFEADAICHYNGNKFDIPTLNQEFLFQGLEPPPPSAQIDLLNTARRKFRLPSNKLDYVAQRLGLGGKLKHKGMELWRDCMDKDESAWRTMERYNKRDVRLLEKVYEALKPWITHHPNMGLYGDADTRQCPKCGAMGRKGLEQRGYRRTATQLYPRYQCKSCRSWCSGRKNVTPKLKQIVKPL